MTDVYCYLCKETAEPDTVKHQWADEVFFDDQCSHCGSDKITPLAELIDIAAYKNGGI